MSWLFAIWASVALAVPPENAAPCHLYIAGPTSRTLAMPWEGLQDNADDVSDPPQRGGGIETADADVESYLRLHSGFARGEMRSQLMPWHELGTLAR